MIRLPQPGPWILVPEPFIQADNTFSRDLQQLTVLHDAEEVRSAVERWAPDKTFKIISLPTALMLPDIVEALFCAKGYMAKGVAEGIYDNCVISGDLAFRRLVEPVCNKIKPQ